MLLKVETTPLAMGKMYKKLVLGRAKHSNIINSQKLLTYLIHFDIIQIQYYLFTIPKFTIVSLKLPVNCN